MALRNADWEVFVGRTSLVEPGRRSKLHLTYRRKCYGTIICLKVISTFLTSDKYHVLVRRVSTSRLFCTRRSTSDS